MRERERRGKPWTISSMTLTLFVYETSSPVKTCSIVLKYWTGIGLSKPHVRRIAAITSGVGDLPASRTAGSPLGMTLKIKNVMTEIANSTATIAMRRLTMKRAISAPPAPSRADRTRRARRRRRR